MKVSTIALILLVGVIFGTLQTSAGIVKTTRNIRAGFLRSVCLGPLAGAFSLTVAGNLGDDTFVDVDLDVYDDEPAMRAALAATSKPDVVIFFPEDNGQTDFDEVATATALRTFVLNGGGLVTGPGTNQFNPATGGGAIMQTILPVVLGSDYFTAPNYPGAGFCESPAPDFYRMSFDTANFGGDIAYGVPASDVMGGSIGWSSNGLNAGPFSNISQIGKFLVTPAQQSDCTNYNVATLQAQSWITAEYNNANKGRVVWFAQWACASLFQGSSGVSVGTGKQVLQNSMWWASKVPATCPQCFFGECITNISGSFCVCEPGYTGQGCKFFTCAPGLCKNNAACVGPNECDCTRAADDQLPTAFDQQYGGPYCNVTFCLPGCQNSGTCVRNGTQPPACDCSTTVPSPGYFGNGCQFPRCTQGCVNGECVSPNNCVCINSTIWGGAACNQPQCTTPCLNGGTCKFYPDVCDCATAGCYGNFAGANDNNQCRTLNCNKLNCGPGNGAFGSGCAGGSPQCQFNPSDPTNNTLYCACNQYWSGPRCDTRRCNPGCQNGAPCSVCDGTVCPGTNSIGDQTFCDCRAISDPGNFSYYGASCEFYQSTTGTTGQSTGSTGTTDFPLVTVSIGNPSSATTRSTQTVSAGNTSGTVGPNSGPSPSTTGDEVSDGGGLSVGGLDVTDPLTIGIGIGIFCVVFCCVFCCLMVVMGGKKKKDPYHDDWQVE